MFPAGLPFLRPRFLRPTLNHHDSVIAQCITSIWMTGLNLEDPYYERSAKTAAKPKTR
jgi:hypothetical protein